LQQLRQLGKVDRHAPRLVARQPIWSPSGATQRYVRNRGRSGSARLALETTLMTEADLAGIVNQSWLKQLTASFDALVGAADRIGSD
jgi:hypothetical protein